jgi:hypothetical protein
MEERDMDALVRHDATPALLAGALDNCTKLYWVSSDASHAAEEAGGAAKPVLPRLG